jgi:spore coat polysaccharide biosynthesis protein SpsF
MDDNRTAIVTPARLHSSRLPRKMLLDIEGRPALWYVLDRMKMAKLPDLRIVCTSTNAADMEIAKVAEEQEWLTFCGDEEDVLQRYLETAQRFGIAFMVNVDGDDLFCSEEYVDRIIERYRETDADYIQCRGLPFGGAPIGVKISALQKVCELKEDTNTQGWGKYFSESRLFRVETIDADGPVNRPEYRMTLDYPEDLEFFRTTIRMVDPSHQRRLRLAEVVDFLDSHPEVAAISQQVSEQYWERFRREHGSYHMRSAP